MAKNGEKNGVYLQKTFNFNDVSFKPRFTSSLLPRHTNTLPWSSFDGAKLKIDVVTLPSKDTWNDIKECLL